MASRRKHPGRGFDPEPRPLPAAGAGVWVVRIAGWRPSTLNELMGVTVASRIARKKSDRKVIADYFGPLWGRVPKAAGRRRIHLRIERPRPTFPDPDALWKSLLDGLVEGGWLIDDTKECVELTEPVYAKGPFATTIVLEDL